MQLLCWRLDTMVMWLVTGAHGCRVWDLATGELKHTLEGHTECVRAVGITPDGTAIISASDDRQLRWVGVCVCVGGGVTGG
jgi:WD40 repeat protein